METRLMVMIKTHYKESECFAEINRKFCMLLGLHNTPNLIINNYYKS